MVWRCAEIIENKRVLAKSNEITDKQAVIESKGPYRRVVDPEELAVKMRKPGCGCGRAFLCPCFYYRGFGEIVGQGKAGNRDQEGPWGRAWLRGIEHYGIEHYSVQGVGMTKGRLEAFSDGVFAVIITIMVLEIKAPANTSFAALRSVLPVFLSYVLSFIYVGIYWNNHHHLLHAAQRVSGGILWANLHLLFWLSLTPFATVWLGENPHASAPVALYGAVLLLAGTAYFILTRSLLRHHAEDSALAIAIGRDRKGIVSLEIYAVGIALAFVRPWMACGCYVAVAVMWLCPDPRIEKNVHE
jgi:uncharacterized membrane protein